MQPPVRLESGVRLISVLISVLMSSFEVLQPELQLTMTAFSFCHCDGLPVLISSSLSTSFLTMFLQDSSYQGQREESKD